MSTPISPTSCGTCASGELDDALVYRKNLRKDADEYTATHAAARGRGAQVDAAAGPADQLRHHDRRARAARQRRSIRSTASTTSRSRCEPVAEPVLATLGLDFEQVIGDSRQFDMFGAR